MAEAVEKVRAINILEIVVLIDRNISNIVMMEFKIRNHCFNNLDSPDFFNTLGYTLPYLGGLDNGKTPPKTGHFGETSRFGSC
jgi:hypothetical protein